MKHQAVRIVAVMLSVLLIAAVPARAGSIQFADVVQALADSQTARPRVELRLRAVTQSGRLPVVGSTVGSSSSDGTKASSTQTPGDSQTPSGGPAATSNVTSTTGIDPAQTSASPNVQVVDLGDVTGTVCDCGEIPPVLRRGGIPWWPLLGLGAVPFFFIERHKETPPGCIVNCGPPTTTVPEPATLLLFGSSLLALGAGARRRRAQRKNGEDMLINSEEV